MKVPVIGPPPCWAWFPPPPKGDYTAAYQYSAVWTARARVLWFRHFLAQPNREQPAVYWSHRIGRRSDVEARTYSWGTVLSVRNAKGQTRRWMDKLLLHELLHWAGWAHSKEMYRYLRDIGGSF